MIRVKMFFLCSAISYVQPSPRNRPSEALPVSKHFHVIILNFRRDLSLCR
jgi:hypothetical protein